MNNTQITELVCTRLSHDLAGNLGVVANAVELLEEGDLDFLDDIKSLLKISSKTLAARMKFFRMAFGLKNANLENAETIRQIAADYLQTIGNKDFPIFLTLEASTTRGNRNALLMVMLAADILIRGGNILITEQKNGKLTMTIGAENKISADKLTKIEQIIFDKQEISDAAWAPLAMLLNNVGRLELKRTNENITFTLE